MLPDRRMKRLEAQHPEACLPWRQDSSAKQTWPAAADVPLEPFPPENVTVTYQLRPYLYVDEGEQDQARQTPQRVRRDCTRKVRSQLNMPTGAVFLHGRSGPAAATVKVLKTLEMSIGSWKLVLSVATRCSCTKTLLVAGGTTRSGPALCSDAVGASDSFKCRPYI